MEQKDRTEGLRALIRQGLQAVAHKDTLAHLGDRSTYIGMSDIGQHWECPRAALARKVLPTTNSLERLLKMCIRDRHIGAPAGGEAKEKNFIMDCPCSYPHSAKPSARPAICPTFIARLHCAGVGKSRL